MARKKQMKSERKKVSQKPPDEISIPPVSVNQFSGRQELGVNANEYFNRGAPLLLLLEQMVVEVVERILAAESRIHQQPTTAPLLRDISMNEIIRPRDLPQCTGLSRTTIHRLRKANQFVPHIKLSCGTIGYSRKLIEEWLKQREERNATSQGE